jgi:hypothetical protein
MNSEQQELVDEAYENYFGNFYKLPNNKKWMKEVFYSDGNSILLVYLREEFNNKCKTDPEFSKMWGLTIEELEFSFEERTKLYNKTLGYGFENKKWVPNQDFIESRLKTDNIPTKLITITYNDKKIESYE